MPIMMKNRCLAYYYIFYFIMLIFLPGMCSFLLLTLKNVTLLFIRKIKYLS
jgi:hypothetical protein